MKVTIEISDELLARANRLAQQRHQTLQEVVEEGLRLAFQAHQAPFRLKKHVFHGEGVEPPLVEGRWETVRDLIHGLG